MPYITDKIPTHLTANQIPIIDIKKSICHLCNTHNTINYYTSKNTKTYYCLTNIEWIWDINE